MDIKKFDYNLPSELIAQSPCVPRDSSKLLSAINLKYENLFFTDFPSLLSAGDVVVVNDTKVIKANLNGLIKNKRICFTLHLKKNKSQWLAFSKPSKKCQENDLIQFDMN